MNLTTIGRFELASRIALDEATGSWFVVGVEDERRASLLGDDIESFVDYQPEIVSVVDRDSLIGGAREHPGGLVLLHSTADLEALHLDDARSQLQRNHAAVLLVPPAQIVRLASVAPHFASWAGNRAFLIEDDRYLDAERQEGRLEALRRHFGMTDEQFVSSVERHELALGPDQAEWLVLLGRSDLLEGHR